MWFVVGVFYNEFDYHVDQEGVHRALTGLLVVGPVLSGLFVWAIASRYRKEADNQTRSRLLAVALITPSGLLILSGFLFS